MFFLFWDGMDWLRRGKQRGKTAGKTGKNFPKLGRFGKNAELCNDLQIGFCYLCGQADGVQKNPGFVLAGKKTYHDGKKSGRTGTTELRQGLGQR